MELVSNYEFPYIEKMLNSEDKFISENYLIRTSNISPNPRF